MASTVGNDCTNIIESSQSSALGDAASDPRGTGSAGGSCRFSQDRSTDGRMGNLHGLFGAEGPCLMTNEVSTRTPLEHAPWRLASLWLAALTPFFFLSY